MASPIEEKFVRNNLRGESVFEFGCGNGFFANDLCTRGHAVRAVDLYQPDIVPLYNFTRGDFVDMKILGVYDNVIAVSAIEHCGIESADFNPGGKRNLEYHELVANKLQGMVFGDSRLIVTVPFGQPNALYYVDKDGNNGTASEITSPAWGYRTFNEDSIKYLFRQLKIDKCIAYERDMQMDHFDMDSWKEVELDSYYRYDNKKLAVLCCVFTRGA